MRRRQTAVRRISPYFVVLPALLALLLGMLAYQLPARVVIAIGSLGDQVFLDSSEALDATPDALGAWYADELGDGGRSRWTRSRARIVVPQAGGSDADLMLRVQGWPEDALRGTPRQPVVRVSLPGTAAQQAGVEIGQFTPTSAWQEYRLSAPATARAGSDLVIELTVSETFTGTRQFPGDVRPKGVRLDRVTLDIARPHGLAFTGWTALLQLAGAVLLLTLAIWRAGLRYGPASLVGLLLAGAGTLSFALWRPWVAALAPLALLVAGGGMLVAWRHDIRRPWSFARARIVRGGAADTGLVIAMVVVGAFLVVIQFRQSGFAEVFSRQEEWRRWLPQIAGVGLLLAAGATVLPDALRRLRRWLLVGYLTPVLLALAGGTILGWELQLLRDLPFVGHADYADNAVVARSLLRGEGWRVPYVTQFYELTADGTVFRPQETWPLLQPVWMAPWMALFGTTAFAARVPNLLFNLVLLLLVYHIGARLWDRRVGALAAVLTLLNQFFFRLTIYSTTDLGFTVLSMAALWLFFRRFGSQTQDHHRRVLPWIATGVATGLMTLQKPTGAIFAVGMLVWALVLWWRGYPLSWRGLLIWMISAGLVVLPYVIRNFMLFGRPVFSTESYDAWILGFKGPSREAWDDIYRIYFGDLPNRSWILRAGWDRTLSKLLTQVREAGRYLLPPDAKLVGPALTWLSLVGVLVLGRRQRALVALIGIVGIIYTLFLVTYWHANEERYFVPFVPWLALLAMGGLCAVFDRVLHHRPRWSGLAGGLALLLLWASLQPHVRAINAELDPQDSGYWGRDWLPDLEAYRWIKENTAPDDVIMTRVPWQLSLEADRPSLMIPNAPAVSEDPETPTIMQIARYYSADYLVLNAVTNPRGESGAALQPLTRGEPILGFTPVYAGTPAFGRRPIYIYRFPADYAGAALPRP